MTYCGCVHANLVRATGHQFHPHKRGRGKFFHRYKSGQRFFAIFARAHKTLAILSMLYHERQTNLTLTIVPFAQQQRRINLVYSALSKAGMHDS